MSCFPDLRISSHKFLDSLQSRSECSVCKRSRKYYCYTCYVPVNQLIGKIPSVRLPIKIDIIKHPSEVDGKSTSAHAKIMSPDDVSIYTYPCIPEYLRDGSVVLVFPGEKAHTLEELSKDKYKETLSNDNTGRPSIEQEGTDADTKNLNHLLDPNEIANNESISKENETEQKNYSTTHNDDDNTVLNRLDVKSGETTTNTQTISINNGNTVQNSEELNGQKRKFEASCNITVKRKHVTRGIERAVFIDCTWNQTSRISTDERLKGLPCIVLKDRESKFWRHQRENPSTYLSTIEAIYYLVRDYHELFLPTNYKGEYDDLLFFFDFMYHKIHGLYNDRTLKADSHRNNNKK